MDIKAFTEPPYPKASSAIFPFCLKSLFMSFMGMLNISEADASYILPCVLKTSTLHFSFEIQDKTLASMALKSTTINSCSSFGIKAVLIS